ncbi:MAG: type IV secretion system DNA-binding domain-containing protein [Nocardioidaceae bacterium]
MSGQPRLVLEARGAEGRVTWHLGAEAASARRALAALSHHLPGLRSRGSTPPIGSTAATAVRLPGHRHTQLTTSPTENVARGVLGALAGARKHELVRLQITLGPRIVRADAPRPQRRDLETKYGEHRFSCEVRIGAKADDIARARALIGNVAAALRGLEGPGVSLHLKKSSLRAMDEVRDPLLWPTELGVSEVTAMLGWPIAPRDTALPGVPSAHPKLLPVPKQVPKVDRIVGDSVLDEERPVAQHIEDAKRATWVAGPMGTGKSTLMISLALADAAAGRSVCLIDAKGDAATDFMERLSPERLQDVVVFSPSDSAPVGIQVFGDNPERDADVIHGVVRSLHDDIGPRSSQVLQAALLTLARAGGLPLSMLPVLLTNAAVRRPLVAKVSQADAMGLGAFWAHFEAMSDAERTHVVAPLRNKLDPILTLRRGLRATFGQSSPRFSFRDLFMDPNKRPIIVADLGTAEFGPVGAATWGAVLLALIWNAAQERTKLPQRDRHPVSIYVDEFQEVARFGDLTDALGRSRGLSVTFTLGHQSLTQLTPAMKNAVMAHAGSRITFRLSPQDAKDVAATTNGQLTAQDFSDLPAYTAQASLQVRGERLPWCTIRTRPLPPPTQSAEHVRAMSRANYGRPIEEVEAELQTLAGFGPTNQGDTGDSFGRSRRSTGGES